MGHEEPGQTPEGRLIEAATKATGRSVRSLAANAGISETRWRQIVKGRQPGPGGQPIDARASAVTLARMAVAVGLTPGQLDEVDRSDAAEQQRRIMNAAANPDVAPPVGSAAGQPDELDMIIASQSMTTREKLLRIRQVLHLRALAEREEAPASNAEASNNHEDLHS